MRGTAFPAWRTTLLSALGLALFLGLWEALAQAGFVSRTLAPPPSAVPAAFWRELTAGFWLDAVLSSGRHYLTGLALGTLLGVVSGVAVGLSRTLDGLQLWTVRVLRPIPGLAWIPFAIIWFGVSESAATFIIAIGVFWINYFATLGAVRHVDPDLIEVASAFGHGSLPARTWKIVLPAATPGILTGARIGLGQAWMAVVAAELFGIAGIGQRMMAASGLLATNVVVVYMLTIAALYGITDMLYGLVARFLLRWQR